MKKYHPSAMLACALICVYSHTAFAGALDGAVAIAASGVQAQSERMKIVAQNIANSDSTALSPEGEPYRRRTIFFAQGKDKVTGAELVTVKKISRDYSRPFSARYDPYHPAADAEGYVRLPNVERDIEMVDMKEAERSYQANLGVIDTSRSMFLSTVDLLR